MNERRQRCTENADCGRMEDEPRIVGRNLFEFARTVGTNLHEFARTCGCSISPMRMLSFAILLALIWNINDGAIAPNSNVAPLLGDMTLRRAQKGNGLHARFLKLRLELK